jgi:hypothetical protein
MEAIRVQQVITKDGEIVVTGLPYKKGQFVEIILLPQSLKTIPRPHLTVRQFRQSGLIGLWKGRDDIQDSSVYARQLREQAQQRSHINYDFTG